MALSTRLGLRAGISDVVNEVCMSSLIDAGTLWLPGSIQAVEQRVQFATQKAPALGFGPLGIGRISRGRTPSGRSP